MKQALLVFLAVIALTAAMVPRHRRDVEVKPKRICAKQTPCAWAIYDPRGKKIEDTVFNTYCICAEDASCEIKEDDTSANALVYKCKPNVSAES